MEKIYEENQNQNKPKKMTFSIVLSFAVALFAIASLVAVGFNQISYAAPDDSATPKHVEVFSDYYLHSQGNSGAFDVKSLSFDGKQIFCIQKDVDQYTGDYTLDESITGEVKSGLLYIINASVNATGLSCSGSACYTSGLSNEQTVRNAALVTYIKQNAIWAFLKSKNIAGNESFNLDDFKNVRNIYMQDHLGTGQDLLYSGDVYTNFVKGLLDGANDSSRALKTIEVHINSDSISKLENEDIYQSDKIQVIPKNGTLKHYYVELLGELAEDAYVVDANGEKRDYNYGFTPEQNFYIRVPANKLSDETQKSVTVNVLGEFDGYYDGDVYVATGSQSVISMSTQFRLVPEETTIQFKKVKDTKMSTAQTIYFIGLIVLLCGVGIIYANAKPVEEK